MRGRRTTGRFQDSLDLLLDTICNAFGGIVLIALLISLVTQQTKVKEADEASDVRNQILEREIARYAAQIAAAHDFLKNQGSRASVSEDGPGLDDDVLTARGAVEDAHDKATAAGNQSPDTTQIAEKKRQIDAELAAAEVRLIALEDQKDSLELRWRDLQKAIAEKTQVLRLPKERYGQKVACWFILTGNEVFPTEVPSGGDLRDNRKAFKGVWGIEEDVLQPVPGRGLRPAEVAAGTGDLLRKMRQDDLYAAILLKEDSVPAFTALKNALVANGVPFGWEYHAGGIYAFTLEGGSRPPQL